MEIKVKITEEDNIAVQKLFMRYNAYCGILGYLANYGSIDTEKFDKKWEEAIELQIELENLKNEMDKKYRPQEGNYQNYIFNFDNCEMVYS